MNKASTSTDGEVKGNDVRMSGVLRFLGYFSIIGGIIIGIIVGLSEDELMELILGSNYEESFRWTVAIYWWISGAISGILFFAFGEMLDKLDEINSRVFNIERANRPQETALGNSKGSLSKLQGFKLGARQKEDI